MENAAGQDLSAYDDINFHHPFVPYDIQETFMKTVYSVLERGNGGVGILESPTGTGKSLSLICASMTWLRETKNTRFEDGIGWSDVSGDEPDWIIEQARARKRRDLLKKREELEARLARIRTKERANREQWQDGERSRKRRKIAPSGTEAAVDEDQFVLEDYESDGESGKKPANSGLLDSGLSKETLALMENLGSNISESRGEEDELDEEIKIFYCSRTHSQLTQFTNELRRVKMPPSLPPLEPLDEPGPVELEDEFKHLTLGSRKNLCINPEVSELKSMAAINERCMELQQSTTPVEKKCCFVPNKENASLVSSFRDRTLATIRDIEEMGDLGKELGICPYYASREVIKPSEIVTLPYPLLLQKSARDALGINLRGHVVIIDEAHNLMDAIASIYGTSISLTQLHAARKGLGLYLQRFKSKLMGKNRVYVAQVVRLLDSLSVYLERHAASKVAEGIVDTAELLSGKGVDQIDLYRLLRYLQESKLARKVESYIMHAELQEHAESSKLHEVKSRPARTPLIPKAEVTVPTLQSIASLLVALTNPSKEGKLFYSINPSTIPDEKLNAVLKYTLLDPTHHFKLIVSEARAVILAGGTMSPMSDYTNHLLSYLPDTKITTLSCGHVIPKANLIAWTLSTGPTGKGFEFTFGKRAGQAGIDMVDELGRALLNIVAIVPDGVIVFFPSYKYLDTAVQRWNTKIPGTTASIWERLEKKKMLFRESKEAKGGEDVLAEYGKAIDEGKGGLLLSVIGGKMSEGINFSDKLGRCVIIVGLPFPNIMSGEWKAKMTYIESSTEERLGADGITAPERKEAGKRAAREFYENVCMRAVNQSVGRAIRHRGDYAAIVMIDIRFGGQRIKRKLPGWIQSGLVDGADSKPFGALMGGLGTFFRSRKVS